MARRPTPNPRRGILRAAITVVALTALLIVAILVVSSLTAPSAKAPTTPPTPGPITPITAPTSTTLGTTRTTATPGVVPSPTHKKTLGSLVQTPPRLTALDRSPSMSLLRRAAQWEASGIMVRSHHRLAWFTSPGNGVPAGVLQVRTLPRGKTKEIGVANTLVEPIWSPDGRFLLYVTSRQSGSYPGVRWTLMQYDSQVRVSKSLASLPAYTMTPLGWWNSRPLFLVGSGSDTSLYAASAGRPHFMTVLAPQVITSAQLSPRAPIVAFVAPTNCYNCTLEFFDLRRRAEWNGPSGIANESQLAWSRDGRSVVTMLHGKVAVVSSSPRAEVHLGTRVALPTMWRHSLNVSVLPSGVRLVDTVNGRSVSSAFQTGRL